MVLAQVEEKITRVDLETGETTVRFQWALTHDNRLTRIYSKCSLLEEIQSF